MLRSDTKVRGVGDGNSDKFIRHESYLQGSYLGLHLRCPALSDFVPDCVRLSDVPNQNRQIQMNFT